MRNRCLRITIALVLLGALDLHAQVSNDETAVAAPRASEDRPEYQAQPLFDDMFVPSKELPEDQPESFPVDT